MAHHHVDQHLRRRIAIAADRQPLHIEPLTGGCVGEVYRVDFPGGDRLVAKVDSTGAGHLDVEGRMLGDLANHLPVPAVVSSAPDLLLMGYVPGRSNYSPPAEIDAADHLARLHRVTSDRFGLDYDTRIGGLPQANPRAERWVPFFAEHRLMAMASQARERGRIERDLHRRIESLANRLDRYLTEPDQPALLHGDVWSGNVLADGDHIAAFLDPAIYFGHPEAELAFISMFSTFGESFFEAYRGYTKLDPDWEHRGDLYNLYPYLVHVRLFGGSYLEAVERTLRRYEP